LQIWLELGADPATALAEEKPSGSHKLHHLRKSPDLKFDSGHFWKIRETT
jgi:hypothetical protein